MLFLKTDKIKEFIICISKCIIRKNLTFEFKIVVAQTDIIFQYFYKVELRGIL